MKNRKELMFIIIAVLILLFVACKQEPNGVENGTNYAKNQLLEITFSGCTHSQTGVSALGYMSTASSGNIYLVVNLSVKNISNEVQYFDVSNNTIQLELTNGHKYYGHLAPSQLMPGSTGSITVYFETLNSENLNGSRITFSWFYLSDDYKCTMTLGNSVESSIKVDDVCGMYILTNPSDGTWAGGYCCLTKEGKYWQVKNGVQGEGTWFFGGNEDIRLTIGGQTSSYSFTSGQYLKKSTEQYPTAARLSALVDYSYGIYEGTDLQIKNTIVGSWFNRNANPGLGFTFNNDYSAVIYTFDSTTNTWNGTPGYTWSYSNGRIIITQPDFSTSFYVARASRLNSDYTLYVELYLNNVVFTHNP